MTGYKAFWCLLCILQVTFLSFHENCTQYFLISFNISLPKSKMGSLTKSGQMERRSARPQNKDRGAAGSRARAYSCSTSRPWVLFLAPKRGGGIKIWEKGSKATMLAFFKFLKNRTSAHACECRLNRLKDAQGLLLG